MNKPYFECIIVILTYKNYEDLKDLLVSIKNELLNYKVIVVNSFYDDLTSKKIKESSIKYNCDFFNIENRGFGYGNNKGIEFALNNYDFSFLICSNPDVIINELNINALPKNTNDIFCGNIITKNKKKQNPMRIIRSKVYEKWIYYGYENDVKLYIFLSIILNKLYNLVFVFYRLVIRKSKYKIFQPHGSFIIFSKKSIEILGPIFDEKMFLFSEEGVLAMKAFNKNINIFFIPAIKCLHKEDGSMNLWKGSIETELKKSFIYFYEKYCKEIKEKELL